MLVDTVLGYAFLAVSRAKTGAAVHFSSSQFWGCESWSG